MSLPAIRAIRQVCPRAEIALVARPSVAALYARESSINRVIPCPSPKTLGERRAFAARRSEERREGKECRSRWSPHHSKNGHPGARLLAERIRHEFLGRNLCATQISP